LRALVPQENAVAGLDLGEKRQALAVTGADGQVEVPHRSRTGIQ
jgi:hypothetical protein